MKAFDEKIFRNSFFTDIQLKYCGKYDRIFSHFLEPNRRKNYLIVLIKEGSADFMIRNKPVRLSENTLYVMFPEDGMSYRCPDGVPWTIKWIVVDGRQIEKYLEIFQITREKPYIRLDSIVNIEAEMDNLFALFDSGLVKNNILCISKVHNIFACLAEQMDFFNTKNRYVMCAMKYIEENFSKSISCADVAQFVGIDHNYLIKLFKQDTKTTPNKMIERYRCNKAKNLLRYTNKKIAGISAECGFSDPLYFSRFFKKAEGLSPSQYRKANAV